MLSVATVGIMVYRIIAATPELEEYESAEQGPVVLDSEGEELGLLREEEQVHVSIDDVPEAVIHAIVAIEDRRFYKHRGLDLRGIIRAAWINLRTGRIVQGASTITQQLARTLYLTRERTITRKISESYLALQMERRYGKDEILEMYLNEVYFGGGATGIEAASQRFFDRSVAEVSTAEAAMLAGSLRAPRHYNPLTNPERARRRLSVVLTAMENEGFLSTEEAAEARAEEPDIVSPREREDLAADFIAHVRETLLDQFDGENLYQHDLEIHTTLNRTKQKEAERAIEAGFEDEVLPTVTDEEEPINRLQPQAALVSMDSRSGAVRAMVGGRGGDAYNRATMTTRQPGSAFKPFIYSAALSKRGYHPGTMVNDMPISVPVTEDQEQSTTITAGFGSSSGPGPAVEEPGETDIREVWPRNFDNRYRGIVSFREALARSLNVPAVRVAGEIGIESAFEHIKQFGFDSFTEEDGHADHYSLALGGLEEGVTPMEMASAYAPFANAGLQGEAYAIEKIVNEDDETIYEADIEVSSVIDEDVAYIMRDMLRSSVEEGTGARARLDDTTVAGKTGTTDLNTDGWFVGFSDYTVTSVWSGEDRAVPMTYDRRNDEDEGEDENGAPYERSDEDQPDTEVLGVNVSEIWADYWSGVRDEFADERYAHELAEELYFGEAAIEQREARSQAIEPAPLRPEVLGSEILDSPDTESPAAGAGVEPTAPTVGPALEPDEPTPSVSLDPIEPTISWFGRYRWDNRPATIDEFAMNPITGLPAAFHQYPSVPEYAADFHRQVEYELRRTDQPLERLSLAPLALSQSGRFYSAEAEEKAPELPQHSYEGGGEVIATGDREHVKTAGGQPFTGTYEEREDRPLQPVDEKYNLPFSSDDPYFIPRVTLLRAPRLPATTISP